MTRFLHKNALTHPMFWLGLYALIAAGVTAHQVWVRPDSINNYLIFRYSFEHLVQGLDLYTHHPAHHEDLFKYSPTFAMFMAPFRALPVWAGLLAWNLVNALLPYWAVQQLRLTRTAQAFVLAFMLPQVNGAIQNTQSNGVMLGLMLGAFACMERRRIVLAAVLVCLGFYVKVFGAAVGLLFVCFDRKVKFLAVGVAAGLLLAILPIPITGVEGWIDQHGSWLDLLKADAAHEMNYSVMTVAERWFGVHAPDIAYLAPGLVLLLLPLLRAEVRRTPAFQLMFCGSLLVWVVIFNHKAESPTYIIAMAGVALWLVVEPRTKMWLPMLLLVLIGTGLSHSDLFPRRFRDVVIAKYAFKAVPCIFAWGVMTWRLLRAKPSDLNTAWLSPPRPEQVSASGRPSAVPSA